MAEPPSPPPDPGGGHAAKQKLRARIRAARRARPPQERARAAAGLAAVVLELPALRGARCVAAYADQPAEPGTALIRERLARRGVEVLLPVVEADLHLEWALDDRSPAGAGATQGDGAGHGEGDGDVPDGQGRLVASRHGGGPEPGGERLGQGALARADLVLVPALAVDTTGARLGQGGGCYDRALAWARAGAPVLALLHDDEVLDARSDPVPTEPHDRSVDGILTPTRWIWLRPRN